jgi:V/A-type H+/Na+-transporting ATPase subunit K
VEDRILLGLGWLGLIGVVGLSIIGSCVGCTRAGLAADGAMLETETGHGKFLGVIALPSSQSILGIVLMFILKGSLSPNAALGIFAIGTLSGIALMISAIYQGECCAMAINVSKTKPEIYGKSLTAAGIVEGFAVFTFVMALVLSQGLPKN